MSVCCADRVKDVVEGDGNVYIEGRLVINDRPCCLVVVLHYNALDAVLA